LPLTVSDADRSLGHEKNARFPLQNPTPGALVAEGSNAFGLQTGLRGTGGHRAAPCRITAFSLRGGPAGGEFVLRCPWNENGAREKENKDGSHVKAFSDTQSPSLGSFLSAGGAADTAHHVRS
jgi:hypothetical protein